MAVKTYLFTAPENHTLELDGETFHGGEAVVIDEVRAAGLPQLEELPSQAVSGPGAVSSGSPDWYDKGDKSKSVDVDTPKDGKDDEVAS